MSTIDGLKHASSSCMENVCQTLLEFQLDVDEDIAATDVREKLDLIKADFPQDVQDTKILKFDVNAMPIITLALTGDVPIDALYYYADNTLRNRLTVLSGVADVQFGQSSEGVYLAQILLKFSERDQRKLTIDDLQNEIRSRLALYPDSIVTVTRPSVMGGQMSEVEMEIAGEDLATLDRMALKTRELAREIPGIQDTDTTVSTGKPELRIYPDRAVLSDLKYPATGLGMTLRANMEGIEAGTFKQGDRNYDIVVKLEEKEGKEQIKDLLFPRMPGHPPLLTNLGRIEETLSPVQITRKDKRRVAKFLSNLAENKPLGSAVKEISNVIKEKAGLPPGYDHTFTGIYTRS